ncbi:MAG: hypothetical protein ACKPKO_40540 [Candidatus Fonsibacter sp.]
MVAQVMRGAVMGNRCIEKGGHQRLQWETLVDAYAGECGWTQPWKLVAQNRQIWVDMQDSFADWAIGGL